MLNNKICPEGKILNPKTNRCIKINNNKKLYYPFINRINANIKKILNIDERNENYCIRLYKYDNEGKPIYRIGNKIILKKQIGIDSDNGIIYLSSIKDKYNKIFKYAIKCVVSNNENKKEIKLLKKVSKAVLNNKCPHFPILYANIKCKDFLNFSNDNDNDNDNNITRKEIEDIKNYPYIFQKNKKKSFYFLLNELANGDLKTFLEKYYNDFYLLSNAFVQIYLSLMFFYQETKYFHYDSHWGNFLYHKIKPGGYFHYNIFKNDYYIENYGFLWVIWDYGEAIEFKKERIIYVDNDFKNIINAFFNDNGNGWLADKYLLDSNFKSMMRKINKELFIDTIKELKFVEINKYNPNYISKYTRNFNFYSPLPNEKYETPYEYQKLIMYSGENMNTIITFILNIFIKNKIIKTDINSNMKK